MGSDEEGRIMKWIGGHGRGKKEKRNETVKERYSGGEHGKERKSERGGGGRKMVRQ